MKSNLLNYVWPVFSKNVALINRGKKSLNKKRCSTKNQRTFWEEKNYENQTKHISVRQKDDRRRHAVSSAAERNSRQLFRHNAANYVFLNFMRPRPLRTLSGRILGGDEATKRLIISILVFVSRRRLFSGRRRWRFKPSSPFDGELGENDEQKCERQKWSWNFTFAFSLFSFDLRQAVAGLFGVMGGRIGFLNGSLEVSSSAFFGVPPLFPTTLLLLST